MKRVYCTCDPSLLSVGSGFWPGQFEEPVPENRCPSSLQSPPAPVLVRGNCQIDGYQARKGPQPNLHPSIGFFPIGQPLDLRKAHMVGRSSGTGEALALKAIRTRVLFQGESGSMSPDFENETNQVGCSRPSRLPRVETSLFPGNSDTLECAPEHCPLPFERSKNSHGFLCLPLPSRSCSSSSNAARRSNTFSCWLE